MATKIRYNIHTSNKYSVFDSEASEEEGNGNKNQIKNKNSKELNRSKDNEEGKVKISSSEEIKVSAEVKNERPIYKPLEEKNHFIPTNDREKYIIPSLNDVINAKTYRNYKENLMNKGNGRNKNFKPVPASHNSINSTTTAAAGGVITPVSGMVVNGYYKNLKSHDYKISSDRRPYSNYYRYEKTDYRERGGYDYNNTTPPRGADKYRRDGYESRGRGGYYDNVRKARKQDSVTIDFDMYRKQQEKKMNANNKNADSVESKKKEINNEKNDRITNNTKRNEIEKEHKTEHTKKKAMNVYQYILEEGGRIDRLPGFRRSFRNYKKRGNGMTSGWGESGTGDENYRNFNGKMKFVIDEKILKNRDPPNIDDTRAFPSLSTNK